MLKCSVTFHVFVQSLLLKAGNHFDQLNSCVPIIVLTLTGDEVRK